LTAAGSEDPVEDGFLTCESGHSLEVHRGVVDALPEPSPDNLAQRAENLIERRGELDPEEKEAYRRNISSIGGATYNQLIRDNAAGVLDAIDVREGCSLDLGAGSGWLGSILADRGFFAVSLDIEDPFTRMQQVADGAAGRDFELVTDLGPTEPTTGMDFVMGDFARLPFADGAFDLVTASAAVHHAEEPAAMLREAARVLRPGGVLVTLNEPAKGLFRDEAPILGGRDHGAGEHLYWARSYLRFHREAGLQPRLHFPGWVDRRLAERNWEGVVYYRRLRVAASVVWRLPPVRALARGPLLRPLIDIFGLTVIAEGRKPG